MRIQPQNQIGPNNTGKMILRGMFMGISADWLYRNSSVSVRVLKYLDDRCGEVSPLTMSLREWNPPQASEQDLHFVKKFIQEMKALEVNPARKMSAPEQVGTQRTEMLNAARYRIEKYKMACQKAGIKPNMELLQNAEVIMANLATRQAVTYKESERWPDFKLNIKPTDKILDIIRAGKAPKQILGSGEPIQECEGDISEDKRDADDRAGFTQI